MKRIQLNKPVAYTSIALILLFVVMGIMLPEKSNTFFSAMQTRITHDFGWFYVLSVALFLVVVLILGFGRCGNLKLGPDESVPDFPFLSWVAMLFAAGMGIGLMFFAVGEPITHYISPPTGDGLSIAAQREAMNITFFHWGIHAWAIYALVGLSLAYFGYRYNLPLSIRSGLYPMLKERIYGPIGHAVDVFAILGTVFGIATSLGFGVLQINTGLNYLVDMPVNLWVQVGLIAFTIGIATISVMTGLGKGVRRLSELNLVLAVALMFFVLFAGSTVHLLQSFGQNIGLYLDSFLRRTFNIYAYEPNEWINSWTLFYWGWWIAWSPFVGMFIARISRGRTVREFVTGVLFVPAGFTFLWMTVFGNEAMLVDMTIANGDLSAAVEADLTVALFKFFEYLPLPMVTSSIAVMLVAVFFITSADSGALVVDSLATGGKKKSPTIQRVFWCVLIGVVAATLLLSGGLGALQTAAIVSAFPFAVVMLLVCASLFKGMRADLAYGEQGNSPSIANSDLSVGKRIDLILHQPEREDVLQYLQESVTPALEHMAKQFSDSGLEASVKRCDDDGDEFVSLVVPAEGVRDFIYGVRHSVYELPVLAGESDANSPTDRHEARVFFSDGVSGYNVMSMSKEQLMDDVLSQYERYQELMQSPRSMLYASAPEHD